METNYCPTNYCPKCGYKISVDTFVIKELNIECESKISEESYRFKDVKIPNGWRLLRVEEAIWLANNKPEIFEKDIIWIEQPLDKNKGKYSAWFDCESDDFVVVGECNLNSNDAPSRVLLCRDLKEE